MSTITTNLNNYIDQLGRILELTVETKNRLKSLFNSYNNEKYKLIEKTEDAVSKLETADQELKTFIDNTLEPYKTKIKTNLDQMNNSLIELQILTLIQKKENCDKVIDGLLDVLNKKIKIVNETLQKNLTQAGGSNDKYIKKYLKYKNKYLSLKKI